MMSSNRRDYGSASEWLSALRQDEAWLSQLHQLETSTADDLIVHRDCALRRIGQGEAFEYWEIYSHQVEPVVAEVWEIAELTLPKLKIQTIGMLSMEWLEQHAKTNAAPSEKKKRSAKKKKPEKPEKPRETMTFRKKSGVIDGHLTLLYKKLTDEGWIEGNDVDFKALFSGKRDEDCQLTWTGLFGKGTLVGLFKKLAADGLVIIPDGYTLPAILEGHFKDNSGNWLMGLDKGDPVNDKALPVIQECVKNMKIDPQRQFNSDDDDEDFLSKYDEYDQQDMHWHKR